MATCWQECFVKLRRETPFQSTESLKQFFEEVQPTPRRLLALLKAKPNDSAEIDSLNIFKRYVCGVSSVVLKRLLKYLTGSDIIIVEKIDVIFVKPESSICRRPIAHTCGPTLELPSTYNTYCELREEFTNILEQTNWEMGIV